MDVSNLSLSLDDFKNLYEQGLPVIDTRSAEKLTYGYIKESITIPASKDLDMWLDHLIGHDQPFLLIEEYEKGHLKNAINLPMSEFTTHLSYFSTSDKLYVYSQYGEDSIIAISLLRKHGFYHCRNIETGFANLEDTEMPVVQ